MAGTPISITFYNPDDSIKAEYSKVRIPLGMVDIALELAERMEKNTDKETWQAVLALLVEIFGNQFTLAELKNGADLGEIESTFKMIMVKISNTMAGSGAKNPTSPG